MSSVPIEVASTIQSASINRHPSPNHDINPSTAASQKVPVRPSTRHAEKDAPSIPSSPSFSPTLRPQNRHPPRNMPPLPDLRFEQSYLASIQHASNWQQVVWITTRDQVLLPLIQGTLWTLVLAGWKHWNKGARFAGEGIGARIRTWWWEVNNWEVPKEAKRGARQFGRDVREASRGAVGGMGGAEKERKLGIW